MKYSYLTQDPLAQASIELILKWQDKSGAYVASPTFSQYGYAWLRDGAFCALAMHISGYSQSAANFNEWVGSTVLAYENLFTEAKLRLEVGQRILVENAPPTRFHLDGSVEIDHHEAWPNYQLDGYGTWLAVLSQTQTDCSERTSRDAEHLHGRRLGVAVEHRIDMFYDVGAHVEECAAHPRLELP